MRGALYLMGNAKYPNFDLASREHITMFGYEARDIQTDEDLIRWTHNQGCSAFVMRDPTWDNPPLSGRQLGYALSGDITRLGMGEPGKPSKGQLAVLADIEHVHDSQYVVDCYRAFRGYRAGRGFYLTTEWHQSGWFSRELVEIINNDRLVHYLPQAYEGSAMHPVTTEAVRGDCVEHGIAPEKVHPFIRHDRMDIAWEGWVYDYTKARAA